MDRFLARAPRKVPKTSEDDARPSEFDIVHEAPAPFDAEEEEEDASFVDKVVVGRSNSSDKASLKRSSRTKSTTPVWTSGAKEANVDSAVVLERQSEGPSAAWVLNQVGLKENGAFQDYADLAKFNLEAHSSNSHLLFCPTCTLKNTVGTRKNVWQKHVSSQRHAESLSRRKQERVAVDITDLAQVEARRKLLDQSVTDHRVRVAKAVYGTNLSVNLVESPNDLKELLEERRERRLGLGSHLAEDTKVPLQIAVRNAYIELFRSRPILATFDGTPRDDEVAIVGLTAVSDTMEILDRVGSLQLFSGSLASGDWVDVIMKAQEKYKIERRDMKFGNSDRGGPNKAVVRILREAFRSYVHLWCIPHTTQRVGLKISFGLVNELSLAWNNVIKHSDYAKSVFYSVTNQSARPKSRVKWWTQFLQIEQLYSFYPQMPRVAQTIKDRGYAKGSIDRLLKIVLDHKEAGSALHLELCALVDVVAPFVDATHFLESRQFISPFVYQTISQLLNHVDSILRAQTCPDSLQKLFACLLQFRGDRGRKWLVDILPVLRPGLTYFWNLFHKFDDDGIEDEEPGPVCFRDSVDLFRFCRLFEPHQGLRMLNSATFEISLWKQVAVRSIPEGLWDLCTSQAGLTSLVGVLKFAESRGASFDPSSLLRLWQDKDIQMRAGPWAEAARTFVLARPSSAFAESLFSLYKWCVSDYMMRSLEDTQELRVQLNMERIVQRNS
jgi:hypothetical protein